MNAFSQSIEALIGLGAEPKELAFLQFHYAGCHTGDGAT